MILHFIALENLHMFALHFIRLRKYEENGLEQIRGS
jgi:hypothetical protein